MAREPVLAAGGIVLRRGQSPRIAVVRLRKRDEWVLPKGKLDNGETARDAAEREVLEETGHDVTVHEFLGTLAYEAGGRSKIVHYWRMEAEGEQAYELMHDIRAVDWLPLDLAVGRLSRAYERAFLSHVGPHALENAAAAEATRRAKAKAPVAKKRRRQAPAPKPPLPEPAPQADVVPQPPAPEASRADPIIAGDVLEAERPAGMVEAEQPVAAAEDDIVEADESETVMAAEPEDADSTPPPDADAADLAEPADDHAALDADTRRPSLAQKVRAWLGRAA
jgi:8-oxo-dGTP diphosphatase